MHTGTEDHIGNKCAIVGFNVSILGKYYIYMYYNVLPNKLTHSPVTTYTHTHIPHAHTQTGTQPKLFLSKLQKSKH